MLEEERYDNPVGYALTMALDTYQEQWEGFPALKRGIILRKFVDNSNPRSLAKHKTTSTIAANLNELKK